MDKYKVAVWGTGEVYKSAFEKGVFKNIETVCFIDNAVEKSVSYINKIKYSPKAFLESDVVIDFILIMNDSSEEIYQQCQELNFDMEKVIFTKNFKTEKVLFEIINEKQIRNQKLLIDIDNFIQEKFNEEKEIINNKLLCSKCFAADKSLLLKGDFNDAIYEDDFFRYRTFELIADEIRNNNIGGSLAEIGVFRGDFSALINAKFPERDLYMFDTFCSFNKEEFDKEIQKGRWTETAYDIFKNTNLELVLKKMKYPGKCIIKKGLFPNSAEGLDEKFVFVSLDVDLENSTFYSLEYIYPRLVSGGYIFIHDYNNKGLEGVKEAVRRYERDYEIVLCKVPIADKGGTLIIYKP